MKGFYYPILTIGHCCLDGLQYSFRIEGPNHFGVVLESEAAVELYIIPPGVKANSSK